MSGTISMMRFARTNHPAYRVHRELVHPTGLWRPDIDMLELVLGGDLAFAQFRDFGANVAEFFGHFAAGILVDLDDLQLDLGNFAGASAFAAMS